MRRIYFIVAVVLLSFTAISCDLFNFICKDDIKPPTWIIGEWEDANADWCIQFSESNVRIIKSNESPIGSPQDISELPVNDYYDSDNQYRIETQENTSYVYTKLVFTKLDSNTLLYSYISNNASEENIELSKKP
jgi:hypothetical protein